MSLFSFRPDPKEIEQAPQPTTMPTAGDETPIPVVETPTVESSPDTIEAYTDSREHLWHELARIDQLIRAQTVRWQRLIAATKPEQHWGMIHVTDAEVNTYLQSPFMAPDQIPESLFQDMVPFWQQSQDISDTIQERLALTPDSMKLRLLQLQAIFGLSDLERDIILLTLLPELDSRYRRLYGYLMDDCTRILPTINLLQQILQPLIFHSGNERQFFSEASPLLAHHLIHLTTSGLEQEPLSNHSVQLDNRIVGYLLGQDDLDDRLGAFTTLITPARSWDTLITDDNRLHQLQTLTDWWQQEQLEGAVNLTLLFHGSYGSGRLAAAEAICTTSTTPLLVVQAPSEITDNWSKIVALCYREAALHEAAVYWAGCEQLLACSKENRQCHHLLKAAEMYDGLTFFASQTTWEPTNQFRERPFIRIDFPQPTYEIRHRLWLTHLPPSQAFAPPAPEREMLAELLANSFQFTEGQMLDALTVANSIAIQRQPDDPQLTVDDLYAGCRRQASQKLITMARRIEPRTTLTFADLILPDTNQRQLQELRSRIYHRSQVYSGLGFEHRLSLGKGLIALFTGTSGTGKTMAAELLAHEQGVDLYKVDLSSVVSKYVGETEKNLNRVFAEAEDANAIIFFDEADALFGKRGEVKEARDRWANMEINFLLQRVEEYSGTVILTSNLRQNIDEAFLRRIHVIVEFPFPDSEARFAIWRGMFPPELQRPEDEALYPLSDRFKLTGGSLKNIVVDAAFRALAQAEPNEAPVITIRHLVDAIGREYQKLGKPISKGEFGETYYDWLKEDIL